MPPVVVAGLVALAIGVPATGLARWWFRRAALMDQPGSEAHKQHARSVPYGGGPALALALAAGVTAGLILGPTGPSSAFWPLIAGAGGLLVLGLVDDLRPLPALLKLAVQLVVISTAVLFSGLQVDTLQDWPPLAIGLAVVWCVLTTNAFNLLDHADGLSGTTAAISSVVLLVAALMVDDPVLAVLWAALLGGLVGFLVWNLPPARIYLGDAGALPLGFVLGAGSLAATFWPSDGPGGSPWAVLTPVLIVALPLYDTAVVVVKRLRRGRSVLVGDRNHISHRLQRLGLGGRGSLLVAAALQTALAVAAVQLSDATTQQAILILAQAVCLLLIAVLLEAKRDAGQ